jgi:hypothetical protein
MAVPDQVSCALGEESVILNMKNSSYYGLNAVGASIWKLLQQRRSVGELRDAIVDEYEVEPDRCERDVLELLDKLKSEGLVQVVENIAK